MFAFILKGVATAMKNGPVIGAKGKHSRLNLGTRKLGEKSSQTLSPNSNKSGKP